MSTRREELTKFNRAYDQLYKSIEKIIIHDACKLMRDHKNLDEFVMSMGTWFFIDKDNEIRAWEYVKYLENSPLGNFIQDWDKDFKITGISMRFKIDGAITRNW